MQTGFIGPALKPSFCLCASPEHATGRKRPAPSVSALMAPTLEEGDEAEQRSDPQGRCQQRLRMSDEAGGEQSRGLLKQGFGVGAVLGGNGWTTATKPTPQCGMAQCIGFRRVPRNNHNCRQHGLHDGLAASGFVLLLLDCLCGATLIKALATLFYCNLRCAHAGGR